MKISIFSGGSDDSRDAIKLEPPKRAKNAADQNEIILIVLSERVITLFTPGLGVSQTVFLRYANSANQCKQSN